MRVVLDTSVLVAALRSRTGASRLLVKAVFHRQLCALVSVPLVLEYEAVLTRPENLAAFGVPADEVIALVKAFCRQGEPVHIARRLRPQLRDPDDEFVLETAFNGPANAIATFNWRDFLPGAPWFGIDVLSPGAVLERIRS